MSTREIRRYKLDSLDDLSYAQYIRADMPKGAKVLNTSVSGGKIYIHALVNPKHKIREYWFAVFEEKYTIEDYERKTFEYVGMIPGLPNLHIFEIHD